MKLVVAIAVTATMVVSSRADGVWIGELVVGAKRALGLCLVMVCVVLVVGPLRFELKIACAPGMYPNPC